MITKDISLEDCILDLIDNCLDGARKNTAVPRTDHGQYNGFFTKITFDAARFYIEDNCGGISISQAVDYAFHFGRRADASSEEFSIGLYGIGMKRAIFKIGNQINILSSTSSEAFETPINVNDWLARPMTKSSDGAAYEDWDFDMFDAPLFQPAGTRITITDLYNPIATQFIDKSFANGLIRIIGRDYAQFLSKGFTITVNDYSVVGLELRVADSGDFKPLRMKYVDETGVEVEIIAGMAATPPDDIGPESSSRGDTDNFGWFVLCNDRVVIAADKTAQTGWGDASVPAWHYQYNGFVGVVSFSSNDPTLLPWRTTKRDVDESNPTYRRAVEKMGQAARQWIKYTNERRVDIETAKKAESATVAKSLFSVPENSTFQLPQRAVDANRVVFSSIQYSRSKSDIAKAKKLLGNSNMSNGTMGDKTFSYFLENEGDE